MAKIEIKKTIITIMGYTFKENCSDIRNTKVHDLVISLKNHGLQINIWDPFLTKETQEELSKNNIISYTNEPRKIRLAFVCVYHDQIMTFLKDYNGLIYDFKKIN